MDLHWYAQCLIGTFDRLIVYLRQLFAWARRTFDAETDPDFDPLYTDLLLMLSVAVPLYR